MVVANMVGTGVFTSLGFQLVDIQSPSVIILLWLLGGVLALCGALAYAELGAAYPRSGGEYNFVGEVFHPAGGFVSGWISVTLGFSAPIALVSITAASYLKTMFPELSVTWFAILMVVSVALVHLGARSGSALFQQTITAVKVLVILAFIAIVPLFMVPVQDLQWSLGLEEISLVSTGAFATALIFVNYAYTGWNAATYIVGEFESPRSDLPVVLIIGTLFVAVLYILIHIVFLSSTPMSLMANQLEIGFVVSEHVFGEGAAKIFSALLAVLLVSTASAMLLTGPRTLFVIGQDFHLFRWLGRESRSGVPVNAVVALTCLTVTLIATSSFESIIYFSGAVLAFNSLVTVIGVIFSRITQPNLVRPFKVPLYPLPIVLYAAIMLLTLGFLIRSRPAEGVAAVLLISAGLLLYFVSQKKGIKKK